MIVTILEALIAIPKIGAMVIDLCSEVSAWWLSRQKAETCHAIIDAAAASAKSVTKEDRLAALEKWRSALSRPRYS